ncbi:hypothetical protein ID866_1083 [Astraeus odoratus]|nr:hypothetical protein ID866_1083 [Astraeus odoratus]
MSVHLLPNSALGFNRPFTQLVKKILTVTNNNSLPVAFKVKTTAPKLYCVRPNSGRIEPGDSVDVQVMLQPMKEEPPLSVKCKDKFLIQSTLITSEKETRDLQDIWNAPGGAGEEWKVHQQKLRVVYLPPEGQTVEEEDEGHVLDVPQVVARTDSAMRYGTIRDNGAVPAPAIPAWATQAEGPSTSSPPVPARPMTPPVHEPEQAFFHADSEEQHFHREASNGVGVVNVNVHPSSPPSSPPVVAGAVQVNRELETKLQEAQLEIQRLRTLLAAVPDPSSTAPESVAPESVAPSEFRHRYTSASSDDGASTYYVGTEVGTMVDREPVIHQDGVPLQVVIIIALGVFITTYLFF